MILGHPQKCYPLINIFLFNYEKDVSELKKTGGLIATLFILYDQTIMASQYYFL